MPPKRPRKYNLPIPLQEGIILKDTEKKEWLLGRMIAQGGFGLIYLASPRLDIPVEESAEHVIKVEYLENGPLFSELKFYQRAAKQECIKSWMKQKHLDFLGIPVFWGAGQAEHNGKSYRFMVMERLGEDLQTTFERKGRRFDKGIVLRIGVRILDILEYIHENEYVHGDIKAANLLFGYRNPHEVYLADYGLSYRYCPNGNHKEYRENPKKGHNGTIEFTSLDAHKGVAPSRRGDLEILGYCMLQWICGKLPWEQNLKNPEAVQAAKTKLLDELPDSVTRWAPPGTSCGEIATFLKTASELAYDEKPEYEMMKKILLSGLEQRGHCYDPFSVITVTSALTEHAAKPRKTDLPKLTPKPGKETKENKKLAYQRKAPVRTQDEQLQVQVSKPLQTQERKEPPPEMCLFHKNFQKIEEKSMQNGITYPPVCQPLLKCRTRQSQVV
ncbi:PREDICTED: serine/threonine-protein kinase VRK2 [Gekko japonicus]|uniref:non-specific serine/threonine protein kinase n=1 Tax=Gekko japonicus TaxID=146911 RepID=A0ABM1KSK1_GEKJA|nr:PREDICTED: serine/threonine-protein kinase VRK2 [Gekko japonicus]